MMALVEWSCRICATLMASCTRSMTVRVLVCACSASLLANSLLLIIAPTTVVQVLGDQVIPTTILADGNGQVTKGMHAALIMNAIDTCIVRVYNLQYYYALAS
jgi:hypothetical protein